MSDISAISGITPPKQPTATLPPGYTPAPTSSSSAGQGGLNGINANTFLQLLVAQLQYQNPSSPVDSTQFLSQTASFEEVQQLTSLQTSMASLVSAQQASTATSMLGAQVVGTDSSGKPVSGLVSGVQLTSSGPILSVGNSTLALSSVTSVSTPTTTSTPATTTPTTTPTTTSTSTTTGTSGTSGTSGSS